MLTLLWTCFIAVGMGVLFSTYGTMMVTILGLKFSRLNSTFALFGGISFFALAGSWCAYLSLSITFFYGFLLAIPIFYFVVSEFLNSKIQILWRPFLKNLKRSVFDLYFILPAFCGFVLISLFQRGMLSTSIAYRVGPDSFGWSDAVNFFRGTKSLSSLKSELVSQLHGTPVESALNVVHSANEIAIQQIPSFTTQIQAEFLLGAHRTGLPYALGKLSALIPQSYMENVLVAFLAVSAFGLVRFGLFFFKNRLNSSLIYVASPLLVLNANLLSQTLEGGIGQFYITAFMVIMLALIIDPKSTPSEITFSVTLFLVTALTSYLDAVFIALPIIGILALYHVMYIEKFWLRNIFVNRFFFPSIFLAFIPISSSFVHLFITPFSHPTSGGWDSGIHPLPSDIFGLTPWLPTSRNPFAPTRSLGYFVVACLISIIFTVYFIMKTKTQNRIFILTLIMCYVYLFFSVYGNVSTTNNYRLWKYSAYASSLFVIVFGLAWTTSEKKKSKGKKGNPSSRAHSLIKTQKRSTQIAYCVVIFMSITSISWMQNWIKSRNLTLSQSERVFVKSVSANYDFVITGDLYPAMFTLYGDVHYAASSRGGGLPTYYSSPRRPLIFLTSAKSTCNDIQCFEGTYAKNIPALKTENVYIFKDFKAITSSFVDGK